MRTIPALLAMLVLGLILGWHAGRDGCVVLVPLTEAWQTR